MSEGDPTTVAPRFRVLAWAAAATLLVVFAWTALDRRLNFDEALALRAGALELDRADAAPPFVMPLTLLLGAVARAVPEPGALFLALRLLVAAAALAALVGLARAAGLVRERLALALAVTLAQGAFATHALEFRYDAAILVGLELAVAGLLRGGARASALAAAALAFVACHQVKGLFLALLLAPVLLFELRGRPRERRAAAMGAGGVAVAWIAALAASGLAGRWLATYQTFAELGEGSRRVSAAESLGPTMMRDLAWWTLVAAALVGALAARESRPVTRAERLALGVGLATLLFALVHPHAWPYMLALPAPFLALFVASRWPGPGELRRNRAWLVAPLVAATLQIFLPGRAPFAPHRAGLAAPRAAEVALLRRLRAEAAPGDAVIDPSGLVYFLPPCTREWYTDSLFFERAQRGDWMAELAGGLPARCAWAVDSYRLRMLPVAAKRALADEFVGVGGALYTRATGTGRSVREAPREPPAVIENFW